MLQYGIAIALVGGAVYLAGTSVWRSLAGKKHACGCGSSNGCSSANSCKTRKMKLTTIQEVTPTTET